MTYLNAPPHSFTLRENFGEMIGSWRILDELTNGLIAGRDIEK